MTVNQLVDLLKFKQVQKLIFLSVVIIAIVIAGWVVWTTQVHQKNKFVIAAGPHNGLSYEVVEGIVGILNSEYDIDAEMIETRDGEENARLLEQELVQLATIQAKSLQGDKARLVASLYADSYQLLVHADSAIKKFTDLRGRKIAMQAQGGTEYEAFWEVAHHYGIYEDDITLFASSDKASDWMFLNKQVDAVFRVRVAGDHSIKTLVQETDVRFIPLEQVEGIRLKNPTREPSQIYKGVYHGHPAIPSQDIATISEKELLIASADVPPEVIEILSTILFEDRKKLSNIAPIAAFIQQPKKNSEQLIPIHEGVRRFWERTKPPFLQRNADLIATIVSLLLFLFSSIIWYRTYQKRQVMYQYNRKLMELALQVKHIDCPTELKTRSEEFDQFLIDIVNATERSEINMEDYTALNYTYEAVKSAFADRRDTLKEGLHA